MVESILGRRFGAVVKIKSNCQEQWSRSRAIVKRKWPLTRSRAQRSRSNCREQLSRSGAIVRAKQKQSSSVIVRSNRQSGAEASVRYDRQEQSSGVFVMSNRRSVAEAIVRSGSEAIVKSESNR